MKVYIVYNYAENAIEFIDKVFDTERKARDYVIEKYYSHPEYRKLKLGQTILIHEAELE